MQQRRVRLGDILDDYCPRERRITNHAVVAMIEDEVKQTRCTTCDADHEYKQAKVPAPRRKKPEASLCRRRRGARLRASARALIPNLLSSTKKLIAGADRSARGPVVAADAAARRPRRGSGRRRTDEAQPAEPEPERGSIERRAGRMGPSSADSGDAAPTRGPDAGTQGAGFHDSSEQRPVRRRNGTATVIAGQRQAHGQSSGPVPIRQLPLRRSGHGQSSGHGQRQGNRPAVLRAGGAAWRRPAGGSVAAAARRARRTGPRVAGPKLGR